MTKLINWGVSKNCSTFHCVFLKRISWHLKKGALWLMRSIFVDCWHLLKRLIIVGVSYKKWTFKDVLWVKKTMEWIHQFHQWWSMRYRFFIHFWVWMNRIIWIELLMKLSREIEFIIVCFLENQTSFKATDNGWLPSMISHFYGLRLVHLGMPLFYPKKYPCPVMSFGTYAFKALVFFAATPNFFAMFFTGERLQLLLLAP